MTSTVFQFLVAGALVMAWIWMLGRPLLTTLARRSRRDSVGHFRHQQAAIGRSIAAEPLDRAGRLPSFHPVAQWRAQPIERRRLQLLLASAIAAFSSLLLAIALRGLFVRLFLLMAIGFVGHVLIGALIGARELRALEAGRSTVGRTSRSRRQDLARSGVDAEAELFQDRDPRFAEGFFEPIPEFDGARQQPVAEPPPVGPPSAEPVEPAEPARPVAEIDTSPAAEAPATDDGPGQDAEVATEATFTAPPVDRTRPARRPTARPIFIESELDEGDGTVRAVND